MTKWQESCIKALASSPYTWEAFKMKQRNKNLLWQYINRIWPYHRIENIEYTTDTITNLEECLIELLKKLKDREMDILEYHITVNFTEEMKFIVSKQDKLIIHKLTQLENDKRYLNYNYLNFNHFLYGVNIDVNGSSDLIDQLNKIEVGEFGSFTRIASCLSRKEQQYNSCIHSIKLLLEEYKKYKKPEKRKKKKQKTIINWLNVGIEIEHDAESSTSTKVIKKILSQNCKEYNSGFDGDNSCRLRENRIRLDGIKGLKGLYTLLCDMQENAAIANSSSVHIHIDCKYDKSFNKTVQKIYDWYNYSKISSFILKFLKKNKVFEEFKTIFKIKEEITFDELCKLTKNQSLIRANEEFCTIEYRFCIPNFNYSDYVIQILFLIHITECIKHKANINNNYVKMLSNAISNIRN